MKDKFNAEIKAGDYIGYAVRDGNSSDMKIGFVKKVKDESLTVLGLKKFYSGGREKNRQEGTLKESSRILILDAEKIPIELRNFFK